MPQALLCGSLRGFRADVRALREHFDQVVAKRTGILYHDHDADYVGWAVTSRTGEIVDGVRRISEEDVRGQHIPSSAVHETEICNGPLKATMTKLQSLGIVPFRARIMALAAAHDRMKFHRDAKRECWRLHVPLATTPECFFEWKKEGGAVVRKHLPADGRAWLVRVDVQHRAVNRTVGEGVRIHLLMSLARVPRPSMFGGDLILSESGAPSVAA